MLTTILSICGAEISSNNGPLVYPNWPPKSSGLNKHPARHQLVFQLRSSPNRFSGSPNGLFYSSNKRPMAMPLINNRLMRPIKLSAMPAHYFQSKMHRPQIPQLHISHQPVQQQHSYVKKPVGNSATAASSKITFHSSPKGPNSGEYIYENPFTHVSGSTPSIVRFCFFL